jgi:hypothetical protein
MARGATKRNGDDFGSQSFRKGSEDSNFLNNLLVTKAIVPDMTPIEIKEKYECFHKYDLESFRRGLNKMKKDVGFTLRKYCTRLDEMTLYLFQQLVSINRCLF